MLSETIDSFKENIKQKIANPFLGTLLLVWIVKNWKVVYAFFFFDKEQKLQNRIDYFNAYWKEHDFIWNLVVVVFLTILILVVTYLFLALSRFISNYYENVIIPQIQKWSKGKFVNYDIYQVALDKINLLESKVEVERKIKNEAINERDEFEKRLFPANETYDGGVKSNSNYDENITDAAGNDLNMSDITMEGIQLFTKQELVNTIIKMRKREWFDSNEPIIDFLVKYLLIDFERSNYARKLYSLNERGQKFYEKLLSVKV